MTECPKHPGAEAVGACARCGRFLCAAEAKHLEPDTYCEDCAARDEVDWLGKHYAKLAGRRSGLVWFLFVLGLPLMALGVAVLVTPSSAPRERALGGALLVWGAALAAPFSGRPLTRWAPLASTVVVGALVGVATDALFAGVLTTCGLGALAALSLTDLRTRLYFHVEVPRAELQKHYDRYGSNPLAVVASRLAFVSLVVPGLGLVAIVLAAVALGRVNRRAVPPVGNVATALGAIVFSLFTTVLWGLGLASHPR